jgi:hypothetical protein
MVRPVAQAMQAMRAEVIAREQQRRATVFRHSVSKAVAEVELCRMPALLRRRVPSPPPRWRRYAKWRPALRRSWDGEASPGVNRRRAKLRFRVPANPMAAP